VVEFHFAALRQKWIHLYQQSNSIFALSKRYPTGLLLISMLF
jgi:hypothetical protein